MNTFNIEPPWKLRLRRVFAKPSVEMAVGSLVLISVVLTLFELWLDSCLSVGNAPIVGGIGQLDLRHLQVMELINFGITMIFVMELTLRFISAQSKSQFFKEFWLDIVATLPLFRVFRGVRALRLLRLIRLVRLLGVMSRLSSHFPTILKRGAIDFLTICGLLLTAILFGTAAMMLSEGVASPKDLDSVNVSEPGESFNMENSFWFSVYTVFSGEPIPHQPKTLLGKIVTVFLMFMGLTIFAIFAGTVSAFMVDRLRMEGRVVRMNDLQDHIVICGWTPKTDVILREYRASNSTKNLPIVIITESDLDRINSDIETLPNVFTIQDDFTKVSALNRACISKAKICIVLADTSGGRSEQDTDARTILTSLTVEKVNPDVYTCAELFNRSYGTHLDMGHVNEFVISEEYGAYVIAQAGMHRGLINVLGELLTYRHGNEFFRTEIPGHWIGKNFNQMLAQLKESKNAILVAVQPESGEVVVNPDEHIFSKGDEVVVISRGQIQL
ncbi:MAG: ion transporter [Planctomycetota bacterium]